MSRAFLLCVVAVACATAAVAQSVPVRTGAALPEGVCAPLTSCEVASLTSTSTVQSNAISGAYAFKPTVNGAKVGVGTGTAYFDAPNADTIRTISSFRPQGGVDMYNGGITDSFKGVVTVANVGGWLLFPLASPWECASSSAANPPKVQPGTLAVITGTTGKAHRLCLCTYNGTAYAWHNVATGVIGDATTCPEAA